MTHRTYFQLLFRYPDEEEFGFIQEEEMIMRQEFQEWQEERRRQHQLAEDDEEEVDGDFPVDPFSGMLTAEQLQELEEYEEGEGQAPTWVRDDSPDWGPEDGEEDSEDDLLRDGWQGQEFRNERYEWDGIEIDE
eukprot:TRINITY_DN5245_c2_g1_i1.p1 TRINITY_DN5245_c2_g1~~TRINITY_DN5245_c2_g1_i1.p1  ORF type:complete len:134 (-),score=47.02 TRINITY_DN5245_c2_g1_i1:58-459(-)